MDPPGQPARLGSGSPSPWSSYDAAQAGWQKAKAALELFGPDGRLNDRAWAEARVSEALPALAGKPWTTLRHLLQSPKAFAFLDRLHAELGRLPIDQELREALVRLWWLRRRARKDDDDGHHAKAILLQEVLCWKLAPDWQRWYRRGRRDAPHDGSGQQRRGVASTAS